MKPLEPLHPYDNKTRRFRHTDGNRDQGLTWVARHLGLEMAQVGAEGEVLYDLSFYSGGLGIIDRLAISLPADERTWSLVIKALQAMTPEELSANPKCAEDLRWLIDLEEAEADGEVRSAAVQFINSERAEFQPACAPGARLLFEAGSGVNSWIALWEAEGRLNYLGFDQG